jgi:uncharacterized protein YdhG (YjbR/CyaY superfamily)
MRFRAYSERLAVFQKTVRPSSDELARLYGRQRAQGRRRRLLCNVSASGWRSPIRKAVPGADEMISYGLPTYTLQSRPLIYFAGWKEHYSIDPSSDRLVAAFKDQLARTRSARERFVSRSPSPCRRLIDGITTFPVGEEVATQQVKPGGRSGNAS